MNTNKIHTDGMVPFITRPGFPPEPFQGIVHGYSEVDLDSLYRSKAAMFAILETIVMTVGIELTELDASCVAGTFGSAIDPTLPDRYFAHRLTCLPRLSDLKAVFFFPRTIFFLSVLKTTCSHI